MPQSAVAARKAALAAKQGLDPANRTVRPSTTTTPQTTQSCPPTASTPESVEPITPKKRKIKVEIPSQKPQSKKQKRLVNADIGRTRYFEAQQSIDEGFDDDNNTLDTEERARIYSPSRNVAMQDYSEDDVLTHGFVTEDHGPSRAYSPSQPIVDSSDEENEEVSNEAATSNPSSNERFLENFVPQLDLNAFRLTTEELDALRLTGDSSQAAHLFLIPSHRSLTFVGTALVTLLHGSINILGTTIRPSRLSHRIFSPRSHPLAVLKTLDPNASEGHENMPLPPRVRAILQPRDNLVVIRGLHTGVERLGNVCRILERAFHSGQEQLQTKSDVKIKGLHLLDPNSSSKYPLQSFYIPESWKTALDNALPLSPPNESETEIDPTKSFVAMIRGPKKCGKSTFARTLLNCLTTQYRRVAFLECDLGQSEFTPGGMVSLHIISSPVFGPPFTHPTTPYRAHYVGGTTPRSTPAHYLSCIEALVQTYRMDVQYTYQERASHEQSDIDDCDDKRRDAYIPLVVNTQGWIKGLGGDLLRKMEEIIDPTDIFDFETHPNENTLQRQQPFSDTRLHQVEPIVTSSLATYYTPADYRTLSILSYFHAVFPPYGGEAVAWSVDVPLCAKSPWEIDCKEAVDSIILTGAGYEDVIPSELHHAINCAVVGLVCEEDLMADLTRDDSPPPRHTLPYTQGGSVPSPEKSHCVGIALIRGIDAENGSLHILTSVPPSLLQNCRILVKGELEMPVWGMIDFRQGQDEGVGDVKWDKVPYLLMGAEITTAIGGAKRRVRKNLMRRGQL